MGTGHDLMRAITERTQAHLYLAHYDVDRPAQPPVVP